MGNDFNILSELILCLWRRDMKPGLSVSLDMKARGEASIVREPVEPNHKPRTIHSSPLTVIQTGNIEGDRQMIKWRAGNLEPQHESEARRKRVGHGRWSVL
jgi:hypothetical protein